jgi:hypothetical protein
MSRFLSGGCLKNSAAGQLYFETTSWKSGQMPAFLCKSKVAVPKTEVLEQPHL